MKKLILLIFISGSVTAQDLTNKQTIGQPSRNQAVGNGFQVADTTLLKGLLWMPNLSTLGGATDSILSINPSTNMIELRPQSAGGGTDTTAWHITGNAGTVAGTNFIGTTDAVNLDFRTNNIKRWTMNNAYKGFFEYNNPDTTYAIITLHHDTTMGSYDFMHFKDDISGQTTLFTEEGAIGLMMPGIGSFASIDAPLYVHRIGGNPYCLSLNNEGGGVLMKMGGLNSNVIECTGTNSWLATYGTSTVTNLTGQSGQSFKIVGDAVLGTAGKGVELGAYNGGSWVYPLKVLNAASPLCDVILTAPVNTQDTILQVDANNKVHKQAQLTVGAVINTTTSDTATVNARAGRFRKDTSGTTFTLTNSYITANSIIVLTQADAALDATATRWTVSAAGGSATITFDAAPTSDLNMNFIVVN